MKLMKWRKWILGMALVLACAESVVLWQRSQGDKYLRYASEPLEDRTRYTFLYPARMRTGRQEVVGTSPASVTSSSGVISKIYIREDSSTDACTDISVAVGGWRPVTDAGGREDKKNFHLHSIRIGQARSRLQFFLRHTNCEREEQPFTRDDVVFTSSFQILPPGAPVPSP